MRSPLWLMILGCCVGELGIFALPSVHGRKKKEPPRCGRRSGPAGGRSGDASAVFYGHQPRSRRKPLWPDPTGAQRRLLDDAIGRPGRRRRSQDQDAFPICTTAIVHNLFSINMVWTLIAGFLVMFMQAGFAMVEGGLCRAKNSSHTFAMNLMIYPLGCFAFWAYGFAIGWGNWFNGPVPDGWYSSLGPGLVACSMTALASAWPMPTMRRRVQIRTAGHQGLLPAAASTTSACMALFFFMMVFMDTTATIPTGAMAERWAWKNFCLYGLWVALPYCIYANWVWGGGWLAQAGKNWGLGHGAVDFAGSGVVHAMGGIIALAGAIVIGPRIGKYVNGKPQPIPGHNIPMVVIGHVHPGLRLVRV